MARQSTAQSHISQPRPVYAGAIILAVVGACINAALKRLESHVLIWRTP